MLARSYLRSYIWMYIILGVLDGYTVHLPF